MGLGLVIGIIVAVTGIFTLVYSFTVQKPHLEELEKEVVISKQELISATEEMAQAEENMLSGVREPCAAPSSDAEIKCIHVFKTIKAGCDSHPVKYPEQEQYRSACNEAEQYLSLHKNVLAGDIGDINTDPGAKKQLITEMASLLRS